MTGSEFYDYVLSVFKRTDKSTEVYEAVTDVIMDIKRQFAFEDFKTEDKTLQIGSLGDYTVSLPSDFQHLIGKVTCFDSNGIEKVLTKRSKETYDRLYPNPDATDVNTNVPSDFCIFNKKIYLGDVPDDASYYYAISYSTEAGTEIVTGTTSVPFTDRYRKILRQLVLAEVYANLGFDDEAAKWIKLGGEGLGQMMADEANNVDATEGVDYQGV